MMVAIQAAFVPSIGSRRPDGFGRGSVLVLSLMSLSGCGSRIPADFAPSPDLVNRITEIRMHLPSDLVCPGEEISASYDAVLTDGSVVAFATRYDDEAPPALHVSFLERSGEAVDRKSNGGWETSTDPLESVMNGFVLRAALKAKPSLTVTAQVEPHYDCVRPLLEFVGASGRRGVTGRAGPDIVVRADVLASPFYERLFVASVEVGSAPPIHVIAEFDRIPPSDWLVLISKGGTGGRGVDGAAGEPGANGQDGCPAGAGGAGGAGGNGGPGGAGGPGGHISIFVPSSEPLLAGLIDARGLGGEGGGGGKAGPGGRGGDGGKGIAANRRVTCDDGAAGSAGPDGSAGPRGARGAPGPRPQIVTVPAPQVFGDNPHPVLRQLIHYNSNGRPNEAPGYGSNQ